MLEVYLFSYDIWNKSVFLSSVVFSFLRSIDKFGGNFVIFLEIMALCYSLKDFTKMSQEKATAT